MYRSFLAGRPKAGGQKAEMKAGLILVLLAGLLAPAGDVFSQGKPLYTFPLGVEAYTYRNSWPRGVAQTLDTIKMLGFTELEGGGGRMAPAAFRKLCDERGISIPSIGADYKKLVNCARLGDRPGEDIGREICDVCLDTA